MRLALHRPASYADSPIRLEVLLRSSDQPPAANPSVRPIAIGILCGTGAAIGWAVGFVTARYGLDVGLRPVDVAFHRFVWAGIFFLPFVTRLGWSDLGGIGWPAGLLLAVLSGPVQAIISYSGFLVAPLAHGGLIHPSAAALGGILLAALVLKEPLSLSRLFGAVAIIGGLVVLGAEALTSISVAAFRGDLMFMSAGLMWAVFGLLLRKWKIAGTRAAAITCALSIVIYAPIHAVLFGFAPMLKVGLLQNVLQIAIQGLFAGGLAIYLYARAVTNLGAGRAAVFPSLVPAFTLLMGFLVLGEVPTLLQLVGLAVIAIGFRFALKQ